MYVSSRARERFTEDVLMTVVDDLRCNSEFDNGYHDYIIFSQSNYCNVLGTYRKTRPTGRVLLASSIRYDAISCLQAAIGT